MTIYSRKKSPTRDFTSLKRDFTSLKRDFNSLKRDFLHHN